MRDTENCPAVFLIGNINSFVIHAVSELEDMRGAIVYHGSEFPERDFVNQILERNWYFLYCPDSAAPGNCVHYGKLMLRQTESLVYEVSERGEITLFQYKNTDEFEPEVSVLIPMYQSSRYGFEAIQSIARQSRTNYELIVVDDGSEDDSAHYAWKGMTESAISRSVLVFMPHRGQAAARNTALSLSCGRWIFYIDADDILVPDALDNLLKETENHPDLTGICAMCKDFISPELTEEQRKNLVINTDPYRRMLSGCTIFRKTVYDKVGKYDESLPSSETAQWMMRMHDLGYKLHNIDVVTMYRRYHNNNFGRRSKKTQLKSYMEIIRQRRRQEEHMRRI